MQSELLSGPLNKLHSNKPFGFGVLMEVTEMSVILCDVTPHSEVEVYRHFGGMYCLTLFGSCLSACPNNKNNNNKKIRGL